MKFALSLGVGLVVIIALIALQPNRSHPSPPTPTSPQAEPTLTQQQKDFIYSNIGKPLPTRSENPPGTTSRRALSHLKGKLLAGSPEKAPYLTFEQTDFEQARLTDRTILLVFYSSWCTLCQQEEPFLFAAIDGLSANSFIAFRVNYKDDDTSKEEKALAEKYGILAQPAKVILHPNQPPRPDFGMWGRETVAANVSVLSHELRTP